MLQSALRNKQATTKKKKKEKRHVWLEASKLQKRTPGKPGERCALRARSNLTKRMRETTELFASPPQRHNRAVYCNSQ